MFSVSGLPAAIPVTERRTITWDRGRLGGDAGLVREAIALARSWQGRQVGPREGPYTGTNHLRSALSAAIIMAELFIPGTVELAGDVPERPPLPEGAIG